MKCEFMKIGISGLGRGKLVASALFVFGIIGTLMACFVAVPPVELTERERRALLEILESSPDLMPSLPENGCAYFAVAGSAAPRNSPGDSYYDLGRLPTDLRKMLLAKHPHFYSPRLAWRFSKRPVCFIAFWRWEGDDRVVLANGWVESSSGVVRLYSCVRDHDKWIIENGGKSIGTQQYRSWYEGPFPASENTK
jgi:hypothetical protein